MASDSKEYRDVVKSIAENIAEEMRKGYVIEQSDAVHEVCDSHSWVIYTHYNFVILMYCSNHDARIQRNLGKFR